MKKNTIKYTKGEISNTRKVVDFLPSPEELALKEELVKVTIGLTRESLEFFKRQAKAYNVPYQKMIRNLLDDYSHKCQ